MSGFVKFIYLLPSMGSDIIIVFVQENRAFFPHLRAFLANPGIRYAKARFGIYYLY